MSDVQAVDAAQPPGSGPPKWLARADTFVDGENSRGDPIHVIGSLADSAQAETLAKGLLGYVDDPEDAMSVDELYTVNALIVLGALEPAERKRIDSLLAQVIPTKKERGELWGLARREYEGWEKERRRAEAAAENTGRGPVVDTNGEPVEVVGGGGMQVQFADRQMWHLRLSKDGTWVGIPLANVDLTLTEEVTLLNGDEADPSEARREYVLVGRGVDDKPLHARIPSTAFNRETWITDTFRSGYGLTPAPNAHRLVTWALRERGRDDRVERTVHKATGLWSFGEKGLMFLSHGGALGADSFDDTVTVEPDGENWEYARVPMPPPASQTHRDALAIYFQTTTDPAPAHVLFTMTLLALLCDWIDVTHVPALTGETGTGKSVIANIAQGFYGPFPENKFLGTWQDRPAALEILLNQGKNLNIVIDDFVGRDDKEKRKFETIVHTFGGNRASPGRGTWSDGHLRRGASTNPRATLTITAERAPDAHSVVGRMLVLPFDHNTVNWAAVDDAQKLVRDGVYAEVFAMLVQHVLRLGPEAVGRRIAERARELRADPQLRGQAHGRLTNALANHLAVLELLPELLPTCGLMTEWEAQALADQGATAIIEAVARSGVFVNEAKPVEWFRITTRSLLSEGVIHLINTDESRACPNAPHKSASLGWADGQPKGVYAGMAPGSVAEGRKQGWLYFDKDVLFAKLLEAGIRRNRPMPTTERGMLTQLRDLGPEVAIKADGDTHFCRKLNRRATEQMPNKRFLHVRESWLFEVEAEDDQAGEG